MASLDYRPDRSGVAEILKSFGPQMNDLAGRIAANVQAQHPDAEVTVRPYTTDRSAAVVTIADPRGLIWQVRDGILTRAAAATGLEVRSR